MNPVSSTPLRRAVSAALSLAGVVVAQAQLPQAPQASPVDVPSVRADSSVVAPLAPPSSGPTPTPFIVGPLRLRPHLLLEFVDADGLQSRPGHPLSSRIETVAPGFLLEFGDRWSFDYTPSWKYYSNREFRDTLDHSLRLSGGQLI